MTEEEIEKDNEMRSLVRKIVYAHAEDYTFGDKEKQELLEWTDANI